MTKATSAIEVASVMPEATPSLYEAASDALDEAGGNADEAALALMARVEAEPALREAIIADAVNDAVLLTVRSIMRHRRAAIWNDNAALVAPAREIAPARNDDGRARVETLARGIDGARLMDFPLRGGLPLRLAGKTELLERAEDYRKQGSNMMHKAAWLTAIAARLTGKETVGKKLREAQLEKLRRETAPATVATVLEAPPPPAIGQGDKP